MNAKWMYQKYTSQFVDICYMQGIWSSFPAGNVSFRIGILCLEC